MSTFFGVIPRHNNETVVNSLQKMMIASNSIWQHQSTCTWYDERCGLGQLQRCVTPEDELDVLPIQSGSLVLTGSFYLTNRKELIARLEYENLRHITDAQIVLKYWQIFGSQTLELLDGWWAFGIYDKDDGSLIIAQCASKGVVYYCQTAENFYFSTSVHEILCQLDYSREPNLPYLIEGFTNCQNVAKENETGYKSIYQLGRGHLLIYINNHVQLKRWWHPEQLSPLQLSSAGEYDEAFAEMFERHVSGTLRSSSAVVAAHLSSGLDSSSVLASATPKLHRENKQVIAYTHVPHFKVSNTSEVSGSKSRILTNEWAMAAKVAQHLKIDHCSVSCAEQSIFDAVELDARLQASPAFGSNNLYWLHEINRKAVKGGANICLTGQAGNASISYTGDPNLWHHLKRLEFRFVLTELILEHGGWLRGLRNRLIKPLIVSRYSQKAQLSYQQSAFEFFNPQWQKKLQLGFGVAHRDSIEARHRFRSMQHLGLVRPGNQVNSEYFGLSIIDPTSLKGVIEFCSRIPDNIIWRRGQERAMIRQAMQEQLPRDILYPAAKGRQSADLADRLIQQFPAYQSVLARHLRNPLVQEVFAEDALKDLYKQLHAGCISTVKLAQITRSLSLLVFLAQF